MFMYKYTFKATCFFEKITIENNFDKQEFCFFVDDMLSEFFYYGNEPFIHTYSAKFNIYFDECYYTIKYYVYSHDESLMEKFKKDYDEKLLDFNELLCINGCDDDFYKDYNLDEINVKNINIDYFIENVTEHYIWKYDNGMHIAKPCCDNCLECKINGSNYQMCNHVFNNNCEKIPCENKIINTFMKICKIDEISNLNYKLKINIKPKKSIFDETDDLFFDNELNKTFCKITKKYRKKENYDLYCDEKYFPKTPKNIKNLYVHVFNNIKIGDILIDGEKHMDIYMSLYDGKIIFFDMMENFMLWIVNTNAYEFINQFQNLTIKKKDKLSFLHDNFECLSVDEEDLCY